ncbi:sap61 [Candida pseudojiufengensis]|uniref:sap61 n=1 Tax=Candida pseudojiufengensis TaxID=497109 RepID=UPI002224A2D7|nr:sap61 [Candida pseudojiufengensis]KAI5964154.1 sap61 [Candida pseudojiufengensis]
MSSLLEIQRSSLENIDIIEDAITKRLLRNPNILPSNLLSKQKILRDNQNSSYTNHLKLLQKHELKFFMEDYIRLLKSASRCFTDESTIYDQETQNLKDDINYQKFDQLIDNIPDNEADEIRATSLKEMYLPFYTKDPTDIKYKINKKSKKEKRMVKRKCILSSAASHLKGLEVDETIDFKPFFDTYNANFTTKAKSYIEFLYSFQIFPYEITNHLYNTYLKELYHFLWSKYVQLNPLKDTEKIIKDIDQLSSKDESQALEKDDSTSYYCKACSKAFTNKSVFDGHLNGKKHKKNAAKLESSKLNEKPNLWFENAIKILAEELKPQINHTEKMLILTEREKFNESQNENDLENEFTSTELNSSSDEDFNESDSDSDSELFKNLPLGLDGSPIPFWLHKLQGLHRKYTCEICGNATYQGKQIFEKHFNGQKHIHGLKCLGVDEVDLAYFKNITSIDEAQKLIQTLKKQNKLKQNEVQDAIEVEDKQGNVMSYVDYLDLKRQGLI